ncbi:hypothetical protein LTR70_004915 [Exophiala xenobiotica]|uniref:Uncharacterized protein n=1 Tax=Lithohypha guttulata TaxID=1690604 RepID=A0ABR0KC42_9EURO|nr:hypothetical protein LTR24_004553 [Lithohypha guttulata]KAK5319731.1 hypothetical protein LTR70_004915 [Exophiala xenobiotica]
MRWSSAITLLCSAAALILSFLCLFAGSSRSFLQNGDLLTLNMSRLGYGSTFNTTDGDGGYFDNLINDAQSDVNDLINDVATDIVSQLNISDFYSVHLMNYCKGMFEPNGTAAVNGSDVSKNATYCSPRNSAFHFNVTEVVQNALPGNISLGDINWPADVTRAQNLIRTASIATESLYIIGIVFTFIAFLGAIFVFFTSGRLSACCNVIIDLIALIALIGASVVATVIAVKAVNALNNYGSDIGVSATKGTLFLGMTWAAVALMLIATIVSIVQLIKGRKNGGYISEMRQKH